MYKKIIPFLVFILFNCSFFSFSHAQIWGEQFTVLKKNNRFIGKLNLHLYPKHQSFMKSTELQVEWWGLSGSPIYYYKFKWQIQENINFFDPEHGNVSLRRSELQKYPDLVKRFDDLRPTDIEITFKVKLERNVQNKLFLSDELDGLSRITYFQYAKFEYDKTLRHVPHIMIGNQVRSVIIFHLEAREITALSLICRIGSVLMMMRRRPRKNYQTPLKIQAA